MKKTIKYLVLAVAALPLLTSCGEEWLEPKPLSFFAPENSYTNVEGLEAALVAAERNMRHEFFGDQAPICTQYMASDMAVNGMTDKAAPPFDWVSKLLPTNMPDGDGGKWGWYWKEGWKGIKYANTALDRRVVATFKDEAEENEVIGKCYFHRAYRYEYLLTSWGDVPWLDHELRTPEDNFSSVDRWDIAEQCYYDMEFAYKWVSDDNLYGEINKGACGLLLMKYCLMTKRFDRAIEVGKEIVAAHPLMQKVTFDKNSPNVILDLHTRAAKNHPANTEILHSVVSDVASVKEELGSARIQTMRNAVPYWRSGAIKTSDKYQAGQLSHSGVNGTIYDNDKNYGRGIATLRINSYYQRHIWEGEKEKNDMRSPNYGRNAEDPEDLSQTGWREMTDLYVMDKNSVDYKTHYTEDMKPMGVADSTRAWFRWPHYILYVPDETVANDWKGGFTAWYVYRSAEAYLLMAEAYYWKKDASNGVKMLNETRKRAGAAELTAAEFGIEAILDERARELFYGERRHNELVRISFLYARTGMACEWNGTTYTLDKIYGPAGTGSTNPCYDTGYNFFYDWTVAHNDYYYKADFKAGKFVNTGSYGVYRMAVHNIMWPIPDNAIIDNKGTLNQNFGYVRPDSRPDNGEVLRLEIDKRGFN